MHKRMENQWSLSYAYLVFGLGLVKSQESVSRQGRSRAQSGFVTDKGPCKLSWSSLKANPILGALGLGALGCRVYRV